MKLERLGRWLDKIKRLEGESEEVIRFSGKAGSGQVWLGVVRHGKARRSNKQRRQLEMGTLYIKLKGQAPGILMNNPEKTLGSTEEEPTKGPRKLPPPEEQAKIRRYLLPDGNFYVPAEAVHKCLLTACSGYMAKSESGRKVAVLPLLSGALILTDQVFPLLDDEDNPIPGDNYEVDRRRARVPPRTGASFWRGRPKIWPWKLLCSFAFDSRRIDLELVAKIAKDSGKYPGLLDYRPEKGGWFGTFEVIHIWEE